MSNKKQTAVEWLIQEIEAKGDAWENVSIGRIQISIDVSEYIKLKSHAKEMDKQQKMDAFMEADYFEGRASKKDFEQYYTETYNTTNP
jgi:hypothetical protein